MFIPQAKLTSTQQIQKQFQVVLYLFPTEADQ